MKGDWFNAFKQAHNLEFTQEDYAGWSGMVEQAIPFYGRHLPPASSILECCCGMGCTAIPLSHYYRVTAFDKDERILEFTRKNAEKFGGVIQLVNADFRRIGEKFGADSFDACSSGGVLEHYAVDEARELVDKQLTVAPTVFVGVPLGDGEKNTDEYGITRYNYTKKQWLDEILADYDIVESFVVKARQKVSGGLDFEVLMMAVKRK